MSDLSAFRLRLIAPQMKTLLEMFSAVVQHGEHVGQPLLKPHATMG